MAAAFLLRIWPRSFLARNLLPLRFVSGNPRINYGFGNHQKTIRKLSKRLVCLGWSRHLTLYVPKPDGAQQLDEHLANQFRACF